MKNKLIRILLWSLVFLFTLSVSTWAATDVNGSKKTSKIYKTSSVNAGGKKGDAYAFNINNIYMPFNRNGTTADVNFTLPDGTGGSLGKYPGSQGKGFLFSGGFYLSGLENGQIWANAQASASLAEDYTPGTVAGGSSDPNAVIYVIESTDPAFGTSWQEYSDAVDLGADFYDGDGDGQYNPVDLNGNGEWDPDEDRPDLIGDMTAWFVFNDGLPAGQRRFSTVDPLGIEVRQTMFAFASKGAIGNILFLRYRFKYVGLGAADEPDALTDVYFGVWADPDVGDAVDDLVGVDVPRNAGFTYNDPSVSDEPIWGPNPPCFMIDFFSGPVEYIPGETFTDVDGDGVYTDGVDTPLDTAYSIRGQVIGIVEYPGAKNLGINSFVHYQNGVAALNDPDNKFEARYYTQGLTRTGEVPDPCNWDFGEVLGGVDCNSVATNLWYSGDPVTQTGWINTVPNDQRMMQNIGPMELVKGEEKEVLIAYVVGQGTDALSSITEARRIDDGAQFIFDNNFLSPSPPPAVNVSVETGADFVDLIWETPDQVSYQNLTDAYSLYFEGYNVYSYRTRTTQDVIDNQPNIQLYRRYSMDNQIEDVYKENANTGGIELLYQQGSVLLDPQVYTDPELGRIRVRVTTDPWTGRPLVKGRPYYFAVTAYALNYDALVNRQTGTPGLSGQGDYYLASNAFVGEVESVPRILEATVGEDIYNPPLLPVDALYSGQKQTPPGQMIYDVVNKDELTGDEYTVTFTPDKSPSVSDTSYVPYWTLTDNTTGEVVLDSATSYLYGDDQINVELTDGFIVKLSAEQPRLGEFETETVNDWFSDNTAALYVGHDLGSQSSRVTSMTGSINSRFCTYTKANDLRQVELRFGNGGGKAYRYVNGILGNIITKNNSYAYAGAITEADTAGTGFKKLGEGFVDVPFTAWVVDPVYGEERQLAVAFTEKSGAQPDGEWTPGTDIAASNEFIIVFNSDYDPNGNQDVYKGFDDGSGTMYWADLRGGSNYELPPNGGYTEEDSLIASSTFFDALFVYRVAYAEEGVNYNDGDILRQTIANYPYTSEDSFTFTTSAGGELTSAQEKELFDKVNVFPNPLFGYNPATSWTGNVNNPDEPFVTFSNLPEEVTIKIYSLSGQLLRTLNTSDKDSPTSPFLRWDLLNESGLRVASGLYLAIVSSPKYGDKVLKFSIVMPQKQIQRY